MFPFQQPVSAATIKNKCKELVMSNPGSVVLFIYGCTSNQEHVLQDENLKIQFKDTSGDQMVIFFSGNIKGLGSSLLRIMGDFTEHSKNLEQLEIRQEYDIQPTSDKQWCCFTKQTEPMDIDTEDHTDLSPNPVNHVCNKEIVSRMCKELAASEPAGYTSSTLLIYVPPAGICDRNILHKNVSFYPGESESAKEDVILIYGDFSKLEEPLEIVCQAASTVSQKMAPGQTCF